jgi:cytidylate kinase
MSFIVAIDGPAGAGKSSVARNVAQRLGLTRVDTGAIYRAVTLLALREGSDAPRRWAEITASLDLRFEGTRVWLGDEDVTDAIRSREVNAQVSRVSADPEVRRNLLQVQRSLAQATAEGALLEGRDIGTVVFPDADVKVFLTASAEERARRRFAELPPGTESYEDVLQSIRERDAYDSNRTHAPLRVADDAVVVDTTQLDQAQVEDRVAELIAQRRGLRAQGEGPTEG